MSTKFKMLFQLQYTPTQKTILTFENELSCKATAQALRDLGMPFHTNEITKTIQVK